MAVPLTWHQLRWQRSVDADWLERAVRLMATTAGKPVILEALGKPGSVEHRLALPRGHAAGVIAQLRSALPGLAVEALPERLPVPTSRAVELRLSTKRRSLCSDEVAAVSRALLTALSNLAPGEVATLQWVLGRQLKPRAVPNKLESVPGESWLGQLAHAPLGGRAPIDPEVRSALRSKQAQPGWHATGRIGVSLGFSRFHAV
jgi:hypothetical protein